MRHKPSEALHQMIYRRMAQDKGSVSYNLDAPHLTDKVWIREHLTVPKRYRTALSRIESTLSFKWDFNHLCWNIVHKRIGQMPYIVFQIKNPDGSYRPIDHRAFEQIRYSIWWSRQGIAKQAQLMAENERYAKQRDEASRKDTNRQYAKDIAYPIMNMMNGVEEGYGNSHHVFSGYSGE